MTAPRGRSPSGTTILVAAILLAAAGRVSAFLRDVALSFYFGVGSDTDAYFIANLIPGLAWLSIFATIAAVFLPLYTDSRRKSVGAGARLAQEATQIYFAASILFALICVFLAGPIVRLTAPNARPETLVLARQLTMIMAAGFLFTGYVGLQNAIQQANGQFLPPLAVPVANNLISIGAIAVAARVGSIHLAVVGAVLGWAVQAPLQRWVTLRYHPPRWRWQVRPETVRRLSMLSSPVMLGVLLDQVNIYVGMAFAGRLGPGAISHLNYAARLSMFLATVFSWLVAYFLFPRLATLAARGDDAGVGRTLSIGLFLTAALTAPVLVIAVGFSDAFVGFVFGRGAFAMADVAATAAVFGLYAWGVLFIAMREMINRVFFSYKRTSAPLIIGAAALAVNAVAAVLLSQTMGVAGIALAASLAALVYAILQFAGLAMLRPGLLQFDLVRLLGAVALGSCACLAVVLTLEPRVAGLSNITRLVVGGGASGLVYLGVLAVLLGVMGYRPRDLSGLLART